MVTALRVTCPKGHLSEMELCRFQNLTLTLALTLCLYVSDKWPLGQVNCPHSQCDARLTVTFPACTGTKLILLVCLSIWKMAVNCYLCVYLCVNDFPEAAPDSTAAGSWTCDLLIASPARKENPAVTSHVDFQQITGAKRTTMTAENIAILLSV